jgi:NAD/NADP transhydrogenase alpha subunit
MVTRKSLSLLAGTTLVLFAVAAIIGNHRHGALMTIANIAWYGFILCALFLIVASVATIVRHRARLSRS